MLDRIAYARSAINFYINIYTMKSYTGNLVINSLLQYLALHLIKTNISVVCSGFANSEHASIRVRAAVLSPHLVFALQRELHRTTGSSSPGNFVVGTNGPFFVVSAGFSWYELCHFVASPSKSLSGASDLSRFDDAVDSSFFGGSAGSVSLEVEDFFSGNGDSELEGLALSVSSWCCGSAEGLSVLWYIISERD
jgi:hypothetical protein